MMAQDSTDPTGVRFEPTTGGSKEVTRARRRKAGAALAMAMDGYDWKHISRIAGYPTPRAAKIAVELMLEKRLDSMDREHLRMLVDARLNRLFRAVIDKAEDVEAPDQLAAVGKARELIADHRRLFGLDAPAEIVISSPTQSDLDAWVARVLTPTLPQVEEADITADVVDAEVLSDGADSGGGDALQAG